MSNSKRKMDVIAKRMPQYGNKRWVEVTLKNGNSFIPSFEDWHRQIQAVSFCEDEKYPNLPNGRKGRQMVADFLADCVWEDDYSVLAKKYKLPIRRGNQIIDPNGASLGGDDGC